MADGSRWEWTIGHCFGAPVRLHAAAFCMAILPWGFGARTPASLLAATIAILALLAAHEFGHALVARLNRLRVRRVRILFFHGLCVVDVPWKRSQAIAIAWGGVAAQAVLLLLAGATQVALHEARMGVPDWFGHVLLIFTGFNLFIIVVNLLPIGRLDGATAWQVLPLAWRALLARRKPPGGPTRNTGTKLRIVGRDADEY